MERFTKQELNIIRDLASGKSPKEICEKLFIHHRTFKNHVYNIKKKIPCETHVQIVLFYQQKLSELKAKQ